MKFLREGLPVISVDTKKKEIVGKLANKGAEWRPKGDPILVEDHDFSYRREGVAIRFGCTLTVIGEDISEQLDIIPAKIQVLVHVRKKIRLPTV